MPVRSPGSSMIARSVRTLMGLLPRFVQERMLYAVSANQVVWAVLAGVASVAAATAAGVDVGTVLLGWAVAVPVMSFGTIVVGFELINTSNRLTESAKRLADGEFDRDIEMERHDELGDLSVALEGVRDSLSARIEEAEEARATAEAAREEAEEERREAERLVEELRERAEAYGDVMAATAAGDLTRRMETDAEVAAMNRIAESFNGMVDSLSGTVEEAQRFAGTVAEASESTSAVVSTASGTGEDVAKTTGEIADEARRQDDRLDAAADEMNDLSATVEEIASSAGEIASTADRAARRGDRGGELAGRATEELRDIERTTEEMVDSTDRLNELATEIGEVVGLIDDVAEQTNVLAINASIEAAHADADGDGFAVVADEVKELAAETQAATDRIEGMIVEVERAAESTAEEMTATSERVADGAATVEEALETMEALVEDVEDVNRGVQEIDRATDEQAATSQEVVSVVEEVAETAGRTVERAERAATVSRDGRSELGAAAAEMDDLETESRKLAATLSEFETPEGSPTPADPDPGGPSAEAGGPSTPGAADDD